MVTVAAAGIVPATYANAAPASTVTLSPITATFVQSEFATHYTVTAKDQTGRPLGYRWVLSLQLVDPAGSVNPSTGSHAAVDPNCNNQGKLTSTATQFVWRHGDGSLGGCDHSKMGPSGHQGKITLSVSDGVWVCTVAYNGTNDGRGGPASCARIFTKSLPTGTWTCRGSTTKIFDNSNGGGVLGGGRPPSFTTKGHSYCVVQLITYHWNNAHGSKPGTIGLGGINQSTVGKWKATGSSGQGGAPNVNWTANVATSPKPVVINGVYSCLDSNGATWSQDAQTHGTGFCQVYVKTAVRSVSAGNGGKGGAKSTTTTLKKAAACKGTKLALIATPDNGKPPLSVSFSICSPKTVQWRIDFGDGQSKVAIGSPPKVLTHVYRRDGDFRPRLTTISTQAATSSSSVTTSVSVHLAQLIGLVANPASGSVPLRVTFGLSTTVRNITTWSLDFGDGTHTGGVGNPPKSVSHTYAKNGAFRATFAVKPGAYALVYTFAQITAGTGIPPILGLSANPSSGVHPLAVTFTIGSTIPGVIKSWVVKFGDGYQASGQGTPPASVSHTYAKKGVYAAFLVVAQQQQYGAVQYIVPRNGLVVQVG